VDREQVFDEDYLYFYEPFLTDDAADAQADLVWRVLELEPEMEVLDLACGLGRIANRLAERGARVTGLDATPMFLERPRLDAAARGVDVEYVEGDMRDLPWVDRFDRVLSWFTSFGYFDDEGNRRVLREARDALKPGGAVDREQQRRAASHPCASLDRKRAERRFHDRSVALRSGDQPRSHGADRDP
jgi:SAM-dependent methyltransferase